MASPLPKLTPGAPQRPTGGAADPNDDALQVAHAQKPASKSASEVPHPTVRFLNAPFSLAVVGGVSAYIAFDKLGDKLGDKVVTAGEHLGDRGGNRIFAGLVIGSGVLAAVKYAKP